MQVARTPESLENISCLLFNFREDGNNNSEEYKRVMARNGFGPNKSKVSRGLKISEYV